MRRAIALVGLFGIIGAGLSLSVLPVSRTVAAPSAERTFLIPSSDGYGVADCISSGAECGKIVADAYCESQGFAAAASFGVATREDFTGTVTRTSIGSSARPPLSITCK